MRPVATGELAAVLTPRHLTPRRLTPLLLPPSHADNKALYVISTKETQIYELVAGTASEKNT